MLKKIQRDWSWQAHGRWKPFHAATVNAIGLVLLVIVGGCAHFQEASPTRLTRTTEVVAVAAEAWPARSIEAAELLHDQLGQREMLVRRHVFRLGENLQAREIKSVCDITGRAVLGQGLVLDVLAPVQRVLPPDENNTIAADPGGTIPQPLPAGAQAGSADVMAEPVPGTPLARSLVFLSFPADGGSRSAAGAGAGAGTGAGAGAGYGAMGVYFDVTSPAPEITRRGIVVHFHGLGGTEYEQPVIDKLLESGFVVLSGDFPWNRWRPLTGTANTLEDVHKLSRELAGITDDVLAEAAYAAEAATLYLQRTDAALSGCPVVMLGFSAGSLVTPTAAARLGDRCAAMVLVASGCNLVAIAQESELTNGGISVMRLGERITGAMSGLLYGTYLGYSKLDPWYTALACRRLPVLMVQGRSDTIVPTSRGDELFERLNAPDVLSYPGGHRMVFFSLPSASGRIQQWVSDQTGPNRVGGISGVATGPRATQVVPESGKASVHTVVPGLAR